MSKLHRLAFLCGLLTFPIPAQEWSDNPIILNVMGLRAEGKTHHDQMFMAVSQLVENWNGNGQIKGRDIIATFALCTGKPASIRTVVNGCKKSIGTNVLIVPLEAGVAAATHRLARGKIACIRFGHGPTTTLVRLGHYLNDLYCARRIAIAHDRHGKEFAKAMEKNPPYPAELVLSFDLGVKPKDLEKELAAAGPELLVIDAEPKAAAAFLTTTWAKKKIDTLLTPRCFGRELIATKTEAKILLGRSPRTMLDVHPFIVGFEAEHGDPGYGVAEAHEAATLLLRAIEKAPRLTAASITRALKGLALDGTRGKVTYDAKRGAVETPLTLWRIEGDAFVPYTPALFYKQKLKLSATQVVPSPDQTIGEKFGTRRTHHFRAEEDTHWVVFTWGGRGSTINRDLRKLGLSTGGACPTLDRLIKDELMARILSITSTKYHRNPDGTAIPKKSLKISFTTKLPKGWKKKKRRKRKKGDSGPRFWRARFSGDDPGAGGRAFGNRCDIYTTFIRRTIFEKHALDPAVGPDDLRYLDGRYKFRFNLKTNKRSELIRALINSYAGAMALTAAHEIGHLSGLSHVTDSPTAIMNVEEGAGIEYKDGKFTPGNFAIMKARFGIAK